MTDGDTIFHYDDDDVVGQFVLGFAFDAAGTQVVLVEKTHPPYQAGKLNGVGGKVKRYDVTGYEAVCREFHEEAGFLSQPTDWMHYTNLQGDFGTMAVFCAFDDRFLHVTSCTDENIVIMPVTHPDIRDRSVAGVADFIELALSLRVNNATIDPAGPGAPQF